MYKLQDIIEKFAFDLTIRNYTERTIKGYRNNNLRFFKYLKGKFEIEQLEDIKAPHIRDQYIFHYEVVYWLDATIFYIVLHFL